MKLEVVVVAAGSVAAGSVAAGSVAAGSVLDGSGISPPCRARPSRVSKHQDASCGPESSLRSFAHSQAKMRCSRRCRGLKSHLRRVRCRRSGAVFANPDCGELQLAWACVIVGHWAYLVAVAVYAYAVGGARRRRPAGRSSARSRPRSSRPFSAVLADRYSRDQGHARHRTSSGRPLVAGAGACVYLDAPAGDRLRARRHRHARSARRSGRLWPRSRPRSHARRAELTAANAVSSTLESIAATSSARRSPGLLLAATSPDDRLLPDGGAVRPLGARHRSSRTPRREAERREGGERSSILSEALVGFRTVGGDPRLRILLGLFSARDPRRGGAPVLIVVMAFELLDMGEAGVGYLNSAIGVGALIGSLAALSLAGHAPPEPAVHRSASLAWGVPAAPHRRSPRSRPRDRPPRDRRRRQLARERRGVHADPARRSRRRARAGVRRDPVPLDRDVRARRTARRAADRLARRGRGADRGGRLPSRCSSCSSGPKLLAARRRSRGPGAGALPPRVRSRSSPRCPGTPLEHLASRLVPLRVEPGTVIVRQGDSGDRFYVVVEGEVEVSVDGASVSSSGRAATSARSRSSATCRGPRRRPRRRRSSSTRSIGRTSSRP